jgi:predicted signal transduction protein with EAL and GGDEF domain
VDTVAWWFGGDEFAILLEELDEDQDGVQVAERLQEELKLPFNLEDYLVFITATIGIVPGSAEYDRPRLGWK